MLYAYQKGKLKNPPGKVKDMAGNMSTTTVGHFAKTRHRGLPEHVKRGFFKAAAEKGFTEVQAEEIYKIASGTGYAPLLMGAIPGALAGGYLGGQYGEPEAKKKNMLAGGLVGGIGGGLLGNAAGASGYEHGVTDMADLQANLLNTLSGYGPK